MKNNIRFGNAEAYIFVECKFRETEYIDDEFDIEIEDEVKMDIPIKLLTENELEVLIQFYNFVQLKLKIFADAPEVKKFSITYNEHACLDPTDRTSDTERIHKKDNEKIQRDDEEEEGREYLFNEKTAGVYQEFEVIKISR